MQLSAKQFLIREADMVLREYIAAGLIALSFICGWLFNGYRCEVKLGAVESGYASALQQATQQAKEEQEKRAIAVSDIDTKRTKELTDARNEIEKLRNDVASGSARLRVNARCGSSVPKANASSGMGDAESPVLDEGARQHYFALRSGIEQVTKQLEACQDILRQ